MRFYTVTIMDPSGAADPIIWSSFTPQGVYNPNALNIELDVPVTTYAAPQSGSYVRVWGCGIQYIEQASNLFGRFISIEAGMSKGLPLANPLQQGVLVEGYILQAFGTWQGTNQYLDIVLAPNAGSASDPRNLAMQWVKGTTLAQAITNTVTQAFPGYTVDVYSLSPNLVLPETQTGFYQTMAQFCDYVRTISLSISPKTANGEKYAGVDVVLRGKNFYAFDNSGILFQSPRVLEFNDLIGQPVYIDFNTIQINVVMRGDLAVGDYISLPQVLTTSTPQSFPQYRQNVIFQGIGWVKQLRHVGSFRQPDANAWITTIDMVQGRI